MADESWTPLKILETTTDYFRRHHVEEARLDAELLLAHALGVERIKLYTDFDRVLTDEEVSRYRELVRERADGRPAKYIIGRTEFYSLPLEIDERALVPRPETELLVDTALAVLSAHGEHEFPLVVDLCTGSGAVVIALAANFPDANYIATDVSPHAVDLARSNAEANGVREKVEFLIGDLFEPLVTMALDGKVDMVVSNPPYVSESEWARLPREIRKHEPREALVAGPRGTEALERIIHDAPSLLRLGGKLLLEMDPSQRDELASAAHSCGSWGEPVVRRDFARRDRVIELEKIA